MRPWLRDDEPGFVFLRGAFLAVQEWPVDQLNVDPPFLLSLDAVGDLNDLAGGLFGVGGEPANGSTRGAKRIAPMRPSARSALPQPTDIVSATRHARSGLMHCDMIGATLA